MAPRSERTKLFSSLCLDMLPRHIHNPLLFLQQLAAQMALLAQMTVAQETIYVELGKEIVTLTQDARRICYVDRTTAILPWDLVGIGTAVMIL